MDLHPDKTNDSSFPIESDDHKPHSTKEKLKHLVHVSKPTLHRSPDHGNETLTSKGEDGRLAEDIANDRAFEPYHEAHLKSSNSEEKADKGKRTAQKVAKAIIHPRSHIKKSTATTVVNDDSPFVSRKEDEELVEAVDQLEDAKEEAEHGNVSSEQVDMLWSTVDQIETVRAQTRVSWTMSRYVHRARAVPKRQYGYPQWPSSRPSEPVASNLNAYLKWLGNYMLWLSQGFTQQYIDLDEDISTAALNEPAALEDMERIMVASEPWHEWFLDLRQIYRWEDPARTAKWCAVYVVLWLLNRVITFILCYIIYSVVRNRSKYSSLEHVRKSQARRHGGKPMRVTDFVGLYGSEGWMGPILKQVGPVAQTQIRDLADFLEIIVNFYDWENPAMTAATLFYFSVVLMLALFGSADFNLRVINLLAISYFFACRPISSLYPKYRHIISPMRWVFWNIPTNSELSFLYLQERVYNYCKENQQNSIKLSDTVPRLSEVRMKDPTQDNDIKEALSSDDEDIWQPAESREYDIPGRFSRYFQCLYGKKPGHIHLTMEKMSFATIGTDHVHWQYSYHEIREIRKLDGSSVSGYKNPKGLQFEFANGVKEEIKVSKGRDEIFSNIIGLSGRRWQHLPSLK